MGKLRLMAEDELNGLGAKVAKAFADWACDEGLDKLMDCCASCTHMKKQGPAYCEKYRMVPPVAIIIGKKKCEGYNDEWQIPF